MFFMWKKKPVPSEKMHTLVVVEVVYGCEPQPNNVSMPTAWTLHLRVESGAWSHTLPATLICHIVGLMCWMWLSCFSDEGARAVMGPEKSLAQVKHRRKKLLWRVFFNFCCAIFCASFCPGREWRKHLNGAEKTEKRKKNPRNQSDGVQGNISLGSSGRWWLFCHVG